MLCNKKYARFLTTVPGTKLLKPLVTGVSFVIHNKDLYLPGIYANEMTQWPLR